MAGSVCPGRCVFAIGIPTCMTTWSLCFRGKDSVSPTKPAAPPLHSVYPASISKHSQQRRQKTDQTTLEQSGNGIVEGGCWLGPSRNQVRPPYIERETSPKRSVSCPRSRGSHMAQQDSHSALRQACLLPPHRPLPSLLFGPEPGFLLMGPKLSWAQRS